MRLIITFLISLLIVNTHSQDYQDVTSLQGIRHSFLENGTFGGGVSFVDFDGDGWDDITLASHFGDSLYFYRNISGSFMRVRFSGLETTCQSKQVMWVDIENDGDKDFFAACHGQSNHLFENTGDMNFRDITVEAGLDTISEYTFGTSFGDFDRDGDMDMIIMNRALYNTRNFIMYENNGNRTFTNITESAGVDSIPPGPFCAAFIDYNTDGWPDIFIAMDKYYGNVLFENNGDGTFTDKSEASGLQHPLDAMSVTPGDYDNDGDIDIFVTNTPLEGNHMFTNNGDGTFTETAAGTPARVNGYDWGAQFLDVENDTDLDLYISGIYTTGNPANSHLLYNDGTGFLYFANPGMPNDAYKSYGNATGDYNRDGFPDIAVNNYDETPSKLWKNMNGENGSGGNWIKIRLQGTLSNIDGYNSKLEVYAGGKKQISYTYCGEGFISQNALHEIFGLGTAAAADSIVITWLSGIVDILYDVEANQEILVVEGSTAPTGIPAEESWLAELQSDGSGLIRFRLSAAGSSPVYTEVRSIDGRLLLKKIFPASGPGELHEIDARNYPPGSYILLLRLNGRSRSAVFVRY